MSPYDLTDQELRDAETEAIEFAKTIQPWPIPAGNGTYKQKRPGLGVTILGYDVVVTETGGHVWHSSILVHAWRTSGMSGAHRLVIR